MAEIWVLTHADVVQDPQVPVPDWRLSARGRARHAAFNPVLQKVGIGAIRTSDERKARDAGAIHGDALGLKPKIHAGLHENDRSATGYLAPPEFDRAVDAFFGAPDQSWRGWETAKAAQARMVTAMRTCEAEAPDGLLLICTHGAVTALLLCHAMGVSISRDQDQRVAGGGALIRLRRENLALIEGWTAMEDMV